MTRRVVIANVAADDNRGGCAITYATIQQVKRAIPDAAIELIPSAGIRDTVASLRHTRRSFPAVTVLEPVVSPKRSAFPLAALHGAWQLRDLLIRPAAHTVLGRVANADLVVSRGDALYVDRPDLKGALSICAATLPSLVARRWKVPSIVTGTEVGPFDHSASRLLCGLLLRQLDLIVVRNDDSQAIALALGVDPDRVTTLPDLAFSFPAVDSDAARVVCSRFGLANGSFAAVTVGVDSPIRGIDSFYDRLRTLLRRLLDDRVIQRVAVILQVDGTHISDRRASEAFVASFGDARVTLVSADLDPIELASVYSLAACSLGTRMHASILSLIGGTPAFPVAVWPKVRKLFDTLSLAAQVISFPEFSVDEMAARISHQVSSGMQVREQMRQVARVQADRLAPLGTLLGEAVERQRRALKG